MKPATGPLHGYELEFMRLGNILVRRHPRYGFIMMMWWPR